MKASPPALCASLLVEIIGDDVRQKSRVQLIKEGDWNSKFFISR